MYTHRDLDIVETHACRVPLLTFDQNKRISWPESSSDRSVSDRLTYLVSCSLLARTIVNARLIRVERPLFDWRPGKRPPDAEAVSAAARRRWQEPAQPVEVYFATKLATNLFGCRGGGLPALHHRDHDLLLGEVYVFYRTHFYKQAMCWVGEAALPKAGFRIKDPDAFLVDKHSRPQRAVEAAGRYSPKQIQSFHQHCEEHDLAYELF